MFPKSRSAVEALTVATARSPDDSPGRVEPVAVLEATLKFTGGAEDIDETEAGAGDRIVAESILLSVSDEQATADVLDN
jgi:hypothetical protein